MSSLVRLSCAMMAALALTIAFTSSQKTYAATFTVNSTGDTYDAAPGNGACADSLGNCTLRSALDEANSLAGDDTINFSVTGIINLTGALPDITSNITINGPGSSLLTVRRSTGGNYRIFFTNNVNVNIKGLKITNGRSPDGVPSSTSFGGSGGPGGGIWQAGGSMTLTDVVITGNRTGNGGSSGGSATGGWGGNGGGIAGSGTLTMTNVVVSGNTAGSGATGYYGGSGGNGGGIEFSGNTLTMTNVIVSGNIAGNAGVTTSGSFGGGGGSGAGIYAMSGTLNLSNVTVSDNLAGNGDDGGQGGGIYTFPAATTTMRDSTIRNNSAGQAGNKSGAQCGFGGGIVNHGSTNMIGCLVSGNTTKTHHAGGQGGGIYNGNTLTMTNCTVSDNHANPDGGRGGGIYTSANALTLTNVTITGNSAYTCCSFQSGQGIHNSGTVNVRNTIIAGNGNGSVPDVTGNYNSQGYNLIGRATSGVGGGSNGDQSGFTNGVKGDHVGTLAAPIDPQLGLLADNGGPTFTHALLAASPALDAGNNLLAKDANNQTLKSDQRGAGRFANSTGSGAPAVVDIGAFELHSSLENVSDKTTYEDTPLSITFSVGDGVADISSVTATSDNQTLVPNANLSITGGAVRTLQVIPAANQTGTATITLTVTHTGGPAESDTFLLTVNAVNDSPTFTKGADQTVNEDSGPQTVTGWATGISVGPNESGQTLSFLVTGNTNPGLFSAAPLVNSSGTLTYTPAKNANGSATITLVLKDNGGTANGGQNTSTAQTFTVNITPVNDAPVANKQTITAYEDNFYTVVLTGSDVEGSFLSFTVVSGPAHGTLTGSGSVRIYKANDNYSGPDSFTFKVNDGLADSANATVSITVVAVNDAPINSVPGAQVTIQNIPRVFSAANSNAITVSDVDLGGNLLRVTLSATNATLTLGTKAGLAFVTGDGTDDATMTFTGSINSINTALNGLTFKPPTGFTGAALLQISTDDQGYNGVGGARTDTDFVAVTVQSDSPVLLMEENTIRAIALDSVTQTRGPFSLTNPSSLSTDQRRRISLFVWNLGLLPGDGASAVTALAEDNNLGIYPLTVEYVGAMPSLPSVTQVVVRLPDQVVGAPRDLWVTVSLRGKTSQKAIIKIAAP